MDITIPIVREAASWGPDDPYVERIWMLLKELVAHSDVEDQEEAKFAVDRLYEKLVYARNHYTRINADDFNQRTVTEQESEYESLYSDLWSAYKDRFVKLLRLMGFDVRFMFARPEEFDKKATTFTKAHPHCKWLVEYSKHLREVWQDGLASNRNAHEHDGDLRKVPDYTTPQAAKEIFEVVCYVIEGLVVTLGSDKLQKNWKVALLDDAASIFGREDRYALRLYLGNLDSESPA